jgi:hypothetical protein
MKKIILLLCVVLAAACTKEEDSIVGTKWGRELGEGYEILEFVSKSEVYYYEATEVGLISKLKFKSKYTKKGDSIKFTEEILIRDYANLGIIKCYMRGAKITGKIMEVDTYWDAPEDCDIVFEGGREVNLFLSKIE